MAGNVVFGDVEAAALDIVRVAPGVTVFAPVTVSTTLVGFHAGARWVQLQRTGGIPTLWMQVDNATLSVEVRAETKAVALGLAEAVRAAVFAARADYTGYGLRLYDVVDSAGLIWAPEKDQPAVARYTFALSLVCRPT